MNESIFRQKSMDKLKSPENLNDYVRVTNPGIWLLLGAIIILLLGACVWGIFGSIESTISADIHVQSGVVECIVRQSDIKAVEIGSVVKMDKAEGVLTGIGDIEGDSVICTVETGAELSDGFYDAEIITESLRPISLIMN